MAVQLQVLIICVSPAISKVVCYNTPSASYKLHVRVSDRLRKPRYFSRVFPETQNMSKPSGALPGFLRGPLLHDEILKTGIAMIVIGSIFVILRLVTNAMVIRRLGLDDCTIPAWFTVRFMYKFTNDTRVLCVIAFFGGCIYWSLNLYRGCHAIRVL